MRLPKAFCWTKYGAEAGEQPSSILERKENERLANEGTFLWGIGTSIRPSLNELLGRRSQPEVLFSPMLSAAAARDAFPEGVVAWTTAVGLDGKLFEIPEYTLVTSRRSAEPGRRRGHYALVCHSEEPLPAGRDGSEPSLASIDDALLRNLRTGRRIGSSQVTSIVVRTANTTHHAPRYSVTFRATLQPPYLVALSEPTPLASINAEG